FSQYMVILHKTKPTEKQGNICNFFIKTSDKIPIFEKFFQKTAQNTCKKTVDCVKCICLDWHFV
ncbi:MAG: hypothetical protein U0K91_04180, partial [Acutalibacteraceae bacterium]|nr:hypothetical protein [Acutalibacteraceae bacterium]